MAEFKGRQLNKIFFAVLVSQSVWCLFSPQNSWINSLLIFDFCLSRYSHFDCMKLIYWCVWYGKEFVYADFVRARKKYLICPKVLTLYIRL